MIRLDNNANNDVNNFHLNHDCVNDNSVNHFHLAYDYVNENNNDKCQ